MTLTFLPVLVARKKPVGWPPMYYREETWRVAFAGQILQDPHPSFADRSSAETYGSLLEEEFGLAKIA